MRRRTAIVALAMLLLSAVSVPDPASALVPAKAGWWNAASADGISAPQPTTVAGDLHIGQGPTGPTAVAAVDYELPGESTAAVLELKVRSGSTFGTAALVACPTKDRAWNAVDNGPMSAAPAYDCSRFSVPGFVSANGDTATFLLDDAQRLSGGYSLALVPVADSAPFQVDLVKPGPQSLTPTRPASSPSTVVRPPAAGTDVPAGPVASPPVLSAATPSSPQAVVAAPQVALPSASAHALVEAAPATTPKPVRSDRFLAGSLLALFAGALTRLLQQRSPPLRLLGGVARTSRSAPAPADDDAPPRGIGRYASVRTGPARKLI
jgi:hypothetical protein